MGLRGNCARVCVCVRVSAHAMHLLQTVTTAKTLAGALNSEQFFRAQVSQQSTPAPAFSFLLAFFFLPPTFPPLPSSFTSFFPPLIGPICAALPCYLYVYRTHAQTQRKPPPTSVLAYVGARLDLLPPLVGLLLTDRADLLHTWPTASSSLTIAKVPDKPRPSFFFSWYWNFSSTKCV